jgi:hypothetical protein
VSDFLDKAFDLVWDGDTQKIMDSFGTDAWRLFASSAKFQEALALADPNYQPKLPTKPYKINQDGSVTIQG